MRRPSSLGMTSWDLLRKASESTSSQLRGMRLVSLAATLLFSFLLDFSVWFPLLSKGIALVLQGVIAFKLCFEERYLFFRLRRLSFTTRLVPIALFGVGLVFYAEKLLLFWAMQGQPAGALESPYHLYSIIFVASAFSIYAIRLSAIAEFFAKLHFRPAQTVAVSFMLLILVGTLLLSLPQMVTDPAQISFVDALFTATSAATVTGFSLSPISESYRMSGQWVILLLIQFGGLGIMTFGALLSLIARRRFRLSDEIFLQGTFETESVGTVRREIRSVFIITFAIEAAGAFLLWLSFRGETSEPIFNAIFHAVSAFCNAGFSRFPKNLEAYVGHLPINLTIAGLIIFGGLGFPVLNNLTAYPLFRKQREMWRLTFHSKMVLSISTALLAVGTLGIFMIEYTGSLAPLPWHQKWMAAFFQSVTARTAGFNTLDLGRFSDGALFFMMILMWIGGSPASTAGGVKTTTFGVMLATLRALLRGREEVELFHRRLAPSAIRKSLSIAFTSSALQAILLLFLLFLEREKFQSIMFEILSAFNTVGLSTGITSHLSSPGKLILVTAMFIGRIGPLTVAFSLAQRVSRGKYAYPEERVIVG